MQTMTAEALEFGSKPWSEIKPQFDALLEMDLRDANVERFLSRWSELASLLSEAYSRMHVATTVNTADKQAEERLTKFLEEVHAPMQIVEQQLKEKLVKSGLSVEGFEIPLRNMRAEIEAFREANIPLFVEENKLEMEYGQITGAQTVDWNGEETPVAMLNPVLENKDRDLRERAWREIMDRKAQDEDALNELWVRFYKLREKISANYGGETYRDFIWQRYSRFDYTPDDCKRFHDAIEEVVVPYATEIYDRRKNSLGISSLRPWDETVDPQGDTALTPFKAADELQDGCARIFSKVDPELAGFYATMVREGLLDSAARKNKAPGAYCTDFMFSKRPFIFMNASGTHTDVQTMIHEAGHAFHCFLLSTLPYHQQHQITSEIAEVASMSMELLASPFLTKDHGGFYTNEEASRARVQHLEKMVLFWPYMAVVDAFQHWLYENPAKALDPAEVKANWTSLWRRFMPGIDYTGLERDEALGWQRKLHIFLAPFYYVDYGIAQLGAVQIFRKSLTDPKGALEGYKSGLSLGGTRTLPELFAATGAKFGFTRDALAEAVDTMRATIESLRQNE